MRNDKIKNINDVDGYRMCRNLYDGLKNYLTLQAFFEKMNTDLNLQAMSFVFYRLPGETSYTFVAQNSRCQYVDGWNITKDSKGVLIVPFETNNQYPMIMIHPDFKEKGKCIIGHRHDSRKTLRKIADDSEYQFESYKRGFSKCVDALGKEKVKKIVYSRRLNIQTDGDVALMDLFLQICNVLPQSYVTLWYTPDTGLWIVATPETLLRKSPRIADWETMALAGTCEWQGTMPSYDNWSKKNKEEHQYVVDFICHQLGDVTHSKIRKSACYSSRAGNVVHLRTDISFSAEPNVCVGTMLRALHPTPAVCGTPSDIAQYYIHQSESSPRKYYAGFSGPIGLDNQTALFVSLRCMEISENKATLYAGGGLLKESHLNDEWQETCRKMYAMEQLFMD